MSDEPTSADRSYEFIRFDVSDGVATVGLDRPEKMNALTFAMIDEIVRAIDYCGRDSAVRSVLLTTTGSSFCVGYDLKGMGEPVETPTINPLLRAQQRIDRIEQAIMAIPKPVVAVLKGHVIGSGLDIALSCDYLIAAEDARLSESRVFRANMVTVHWLPLYVGWAKARDMLYRGTIVNGREAADIGLVNLAVPESDVDKEGLAVATEFAHGPTVALGLFKRALNEPVIAGVSRGRELSNLYGLVLSGTEDLKEARNAFREKRKAIFRGQ